MTKPDGVKTRISIVVPVLNEADGIPQLRSKLGRVHSVLAEFGDIEFVFVDDGSTDATLPLLRMAFPEGDLCRIVSHGRNRGVGAAFRTGFQQTTGSIVCTIDADCSYEPEGLKHLVEEMIEAKADVAVASPYHPEGGVQGVGAWRLVLSKVCSAIYRVISPVPLYTYTSIFRAYRWAVIENVKFESDGFVSAAEILIHAAEQGYQVIEVPMVLRARQLGTTKMKIVRTIGLHLAMMSTILLQRFGMSRMQAGRRAPEILANVPHPTTNAGYQYSTEKE
jgi:dolichol-phosphate mannosyltransferase